MLHTYRVGGRTFTVKPGESHSEAWSAADKAFEDARKAAS